MKNKKKFFIIMASLVILISVLYVFKNGIANRKNGENLVDTKSEESSDERQIEFTDFKSALESEDQLDEFFAGHDISMDHLKSAGKPMVLFFSWEDCGPCKIIEPVMFDLYKENPDILFKYIEIVQLSSFAQQYPVRVTPSFLFLNKDGQVFEFSDSLKEDLRFTTYTNQETNERVDIFEGLIPEEQLKEMIQEMNDL